MTEYKGIQMPVDETEFVKSLKTSILQGGEDCVAVRTKKKTYTYPGKKYIFCTDGFRSFHSMVHEILRLDYGIRHHVLDQLDKSLTTFPIDQYVRKFDFDKTMKLAEELRDKEGTPIVLWMIRNDLMYLGPKGNLKVSFSQIKHEKKRDRVSSNIIVHEANPESRRLIFLADSPGHQRIYRKLYEAAYAEEMKRYTLRYSQEWYMPVPTATEDDIWGTNYIIPTFTRR